MRKGVGKGKDTAANGRRAEDLLSQKTEIRRMARYARDGQSDTTGILGWHSRAGDLPRRARRRRRAAPGLAGFKRRRPRSHRTIMFGGSPEPHIVFVHDCIAGRFERPAAEGFN
jgi:hypothetical protein